MKDNWGTLPLKTNPPRGQRHSLYIGDVIVEKNWFESTNNFNFLLYVSTPRETVTRAATRLKYFIVSIAIEIVHYDVLWRIMRIMRARI